MDPTSMAKRGDLNSPEKSSHKIQTIHSGQLLQTYYDNTFMVWNYEIYLELRSFLLYGTGKWLWNESSQICDQIPWLQNYLNWIKLN